MSGADRFTEASGPSLRFHARGTGPHTMLFFHGLTGSIESWDAIAPVLEPHARLVMADQRGAGLSEKVRHAYDLDDLVADATAVLEAAGVDGPVTLVGHATGAALAFAFAGAHPVRVARMILLSPSVDADPERAKYLAERSAVAAREGMRAIVDTVLDRSWPADRRGDGAAFSAYRARFLAIDPVCYAQANAVLASARLAPVIDGWSGRVHLVAGARDLLRPPQAVQALKARLRQATLTEIDAVHLSPMQAPALVAAEIRAALA